MISRELAKHVDFLSIGTNDLTQYTLAMDRQNPLLKDKYNDHHPAILRMVRMVVDAAHQEGRKVGICGEIAADTALTKNFWRWELIFCLLFRRVYFRYEKQFVRQILAERKFLLLNEDYNE